MALRSGYKGIKKVGPGLSYSNVTGELDLNGDIGGGSFDLIFGSETITHPAVSTSPIELTADYTQYDALLFVAGFTGSNAASYMTSVIPVEAITQSTGTGDNDKCAFILVYSSQYIRIAKGADNTHLVFSAISGVGIYQVFGIKY